METKNTQQNDGPIERTRTCFLELLSKLEPLELVGLAHLLHIPIHQETASPNVAARPTLRGRYDLMYDIGYAFINMKRVPRKRLMGLLREATSSNEGRKELANYRYQEIPADLWEK